MAADLRANAVAGDGQSATVTSLSITVPASAVAGDYAVLAVASSSNTVSLTTPAGWTLLQGPDAVGSGFTSWLLGKTLAGGDIGAGVTLTLSGARRVVAQMSAYSGVTATGLATSTVTETSATSTPGTPTLTSVPAGAVVHVSYLRRFGGTPATDITPPGGFSQGTANRAATNYGGSPEYSAESAYLIAPSSGTYGGTAATATSVSTGANYALMLQAVGGGGGSDVTVVGVAAQVSAEADPGTFTSGTNVVVDGVPAQATAQAASGSIVGTTITPTPTAQVWPPEPYRSAIRNGVAIYYSATATRGGVTVAEDLRPTGGSITDTSRPGVRRTLSLELASEPGLYDDLTPTGTQLSVVAHIRYTNRATFDLPMGVFDIDAESTSVSGGTISLTAPDKWIQIVRARFVRPQGSTRGALVTAQIASLIRGALGADEPVIITATSTAKVGTLTWERDRDKAIIDLARQIGAWVYFDRDGVATIADAPVLGINADWLIDAGESGVLTDLDRERSRTNTCNVVVVESSATDRARFPVQYIWDNDPTSPTYAGPGTGWGTTMPSATTAGPFGIVPFFHDSPILSNAQEARQAGRTILARVVGLASQVSLSQVPNPALDAFDVIDVLPPGREPMGVTDAGGFGDGFGVGGFGVMPFGGGDTVTSGGRIVYRITARMERHICDTVTHPLALGAAQRIEGRSTRTDDWSEGS